MTKRETFSEETSQDPIEREIARRVVRILNDKSLTAQRRCELVREQLQALTAHRSKQQKQG